MKETPPVIDTEPWLKEPMSQFKVHDYAGYMGWNRVLVLWQRHYYTGLLKTNVLTRLP